MLAFDNVDLSPRSVIAPNVVVLFSRSANPERQFKSSPIGLADILIISMCAYTTFLIAFKAAVSGLSQGGGLACVSGPMQKGPMMTPMVIRMRAAAAVVAFVWAGVVAIALMAGLRVLTVGCAARKIADQNSGQQKSQHKLAGLFDSAKQFRVMVAGAGFEPTTFGL